MEQTVVLVEEGKWNEAFRSFGIEEYSKVFILVDSNTEKHCFPLLNEKLEKLNVSCIKLVVPAGEATKALSVCTLLWEELTKYKADRKSLLINLGGGMISDLGGFVASVYKRGIDFINIPTSLLGMIDAAIGGKCGIDFLSLKNHLGVFQLAKSTMVYPFFLNTLPKEELKSGFAEALKHALITDMGYWKSLQVVSLDEALSANVISRSIAIKSAIVASDPKEKGARKMLNFGHTIGHAIESYFFEKGSPIPHGFAIAAGIHCEAYLSSRLCALSETALKEISDTILRYYEPIQLGEELSETLLAFIEQDKKNEGGETRFSLLKAIGTGLTDVPVSQELIRDSLNYYRQLG
jgi:3-dehydroquinate synthase